MDSFFWKREDGAIFEEPEYHVTGDQIAEAAKVIQPYIVKTQVVESEALTQILGRPVFLKCENQQITGSFKIRGALARLSVIKGEARYRGVIAASAGNHGIGVAHACRQFGIPGLVVVPEEAPAIKVQALHDMYVKVRKFGSCYDEAEAHAKRLAEENEATFISPYDDSWIIAGNGGTLGLEIADQIPDLSAVVTPVGGGGLAIGLAQSLPNVPVMGVNTHASPAMITSLLEGRVFETFASKGTIAEGLEGGVSTNTVSLCAKMLDSMGAVSEKGLREAVTLVMKQHKEIIEGSAAAPVAAILENLPIPGKGPVCLVLTGRNIDRKMLQNIVLDGENTNA